MSDVKQEIKNAAEYLAGRLKTAGAIVQRYDAASGSVYLKFDYGAAQSIRIADHQGKKHLKYRYNLLTCVQAHETVIDKYPRLYWPLSSVQDCADHIIRDREAKMAQFGYHYGEFMQDNKARNAKTKGFWKQARLV